MAGGKRTQRPAGDTDSPLGVTVEKMPAVLGRPTASCGSRPHIEGGLGVRTFGPTRSRG